jgi:hypothetical protein
MEISIKDSMGVTKKPVKSQHRPRAAVADHVPCKTLFASLNISLVPVAEFETHHSPSDLMYGIQTQQAILPRSEIR